jgi:hypothetical protein
MIRRHNIIVIVIAFAASAGIWIMSLNKDNPKKKNHLSAKVFEGSCGWGYDILVNDTLLIHQESVPVLTGKKGFLKKEQAEQTAQLIINKMKKGQLPTVTTFELQQIFSFNQAQYGQPGKSK